MTKKTFTHQTSLFSFLSFIVLFGLTNCEDEEQKTPVVNEFSPDSGIVGTIVTISGSNFSEIPSNNIVKFNSTTATVSSATPASLVVEVPSGASTGNVSVTTNGKTGTSAGDFIVVGSPEITTISPSFGLPGQTITVTGKNFSSTVSENVVMFDALAATISAASETTLVVVVPAEAKTGKIKITVHGMTATSTEDFVIPPTVTTFAPTSGIVGSDVTITGTSFSTTFTNNIVLINDKVAQVKSASPTSLTVAIPSGATTGKISVTVSGKTALTAANFVVLPKITSISPNAGAVGSTFIVTGTGFRPNASDNILKLNNVAVTIASATATSITAIVPPGATSGKISVAVGGNTSESLNDFQVVLEAIIASGPDYENAFALAVDATGSSYITGRFRGTVMFGATPLTATSTFSDIFIAKYNSAGHLEWAKRYGGSLEDDGQSIAVDQTGNVYVVGSFMGTVSFGSTSLTSAGGDGYVAKFNSAGDAVWAIKVGSADSRVEYGTSVKVDGSGNVFAAINFFNTVNVGAATLTSAGEGDMIIAKLNANTGAEVWVKQFGGVGDESILSIALAPSGDIFFSGGYFTSAVLGAVSLTAIDGLDAFVGKLDSSGDLKWVKAISATGWENALSLGTDANSNCFVTGYLSGNISIGNIALSPIGNQDVFVAKITSLGEVSWAKTAGGADYENGESVAVDANGNAYLTGYFTRTATFGDKSLTSNNISRDIFVSKLSATGEFLWTKQAGSSENDYGHSIAVDASGTIHVTGSFSRDITIGTTPLTNNGGDDIYLWKIFQEHL
jgi:hypothetical protein